MLPVQRYDPPDAKSLETNSIYLSGFQESVLGIRTSLLAVDRYAAHAISENLVLSRAPGFSYDWLLWYLRLPGDGPMIDSLSFIDRSVTRYL